jgi:hypothetical protein
MKRKEAYETRRERLGDCTKILTFRLSEAKSDFKGDRLFEQDEDKHEYERVRAHR